MVTIIAITGIDGTGKTTSSKSLKIALEDQGYKVDYKHQFHSVFATIINSIKGLRLRFLSAGSSSTNASLALPSNPRSRFMKIKKYLAYCYLLLKAVQTNFHYISSKKIIIYDRFMFDDFVRFQQRYQLSANFLGVIDRLVLRPDILIMLSGDAKKTYERQVDVDSSYEGYMEKLQIHNRVMSGLKARGYNTVSIDTIKSPTADVVSTIVVAAEKVFR